MAKEKKQSLLSSGSFVWCVFTTQNFFTRMEIIKWGFILENIPQNRRGKFARLDKYSTIQVSADKLKEAQLNARNYSVYRTRLLWTAIFDLEQLFMAKEKKMQNVELASMLEDKHFRSKLNTQFFSNESSSLVAVEILFGSAESIGSVWKIYYTAQK